MIKKFEFISKSSTLKKLKLGIKQSRILPIYSFSINEWKNNKKNILTEIRKKFTKKIIIRSSVIGEDSVNESQAGKYLSLKDINPKNNLELNNSIEKVYKSYKSKNLLNEILIQPVLKNVSMSGVIFTYDNEDGSPYYCIEYDDLTGLTDTVTSGLNDKSRTLYVLRSKFRLLKSQRFLNLINATKEIEKITSFHKLDIEFGVNKKNEIFIFQVRPLVIKTIFKKKVIKKINKKILIIENFLRTSLKKSKVQNLFGVMPDWNPAEIIGITPHPLSLSLYSKMITDNVWAKSRKMLGYKNLIGNKLLRTFASHPYVNINHSFNSFLPNDLDKKISKKLINFWINDLSKNGHMHDKIEFEICTTCFDFSLRKQLLRYKNILSKKELTNYENSLKKLTKKIIFDNNHNIHLYKNNLDKLEEYRLNFNKKKLFNFSEFNKFIEYIKDYGTITFANSARIGFISENFLRSFSSQQLLTDKRIEEFKNSIVTVLGEFVHDTNDLIKKKISWKNFKEIYGHLRSGTYDITSNRYDNSKYFKHLKIKSEIKYFKKKFFKLTNAEQEKINKEIKKHKLEINAEQLINFISSNISFREYSKFIFTKSLSDLLEKIAIKGKMINLSREDLSFLSFKDLSLLDNKKNIKTLKYLIKNNKKIHYFNKSIKLPYLITKESDLSIIPLLKGLPSFITSKKISSKTIQLKGKNMSKSLNLKNKIIIIEQADPGYDWIFLHGIAGLITKYGGTNSHMAIRCAELAVPAAIGCGDQLFKKLKKTNFIDLDCFSKKIKLIN